VIFVDPLMDFGWKLRGHRTKSCHMTTDGPIDGLHEMAKAIGMKRSWFQPSPPASIDHYDLTPSRRLKAIELGAIELSRKEAVEHWRRVRNEILHNRG
jgi:Protein of unknown function (DUF4031)